MTLEQPGIELPNQEDQQGEVKYLHHFDTSRLCGVSPGFARVTRCCCVKKYHFPRHVPAIGHKPKHIGSSPTLFCGAQVSTQTVLIVGDVLAGETESVYLRY